MTIFNALLFYLVSLVEGKREQNSEINFYVHSPSKKKKRKKRNKNDKENTTTTYKKAAKKKLKV